MAQMIDASEKFVDAWDMQTKYPNSFEIPSKEALKRLKAGDNVKVCCNTERFWIKLTRPIAFDGVLTGQVDNVLIPGEPTVPQNPSL